MNVQGCELDSMILSIFQTAASLIQGICEFINFYCAHKSLMNPHRGIDDDNNNKNDNNNSRRTKATTPAISMAEIITLAALLSGLLFSSSVSRLQCE